jgi:hypothetical protein
VSAPRSAGRAKAHQVASVHEEAAAVAIAMFAGSRLLARPEAWDRLD